jgi:hypothetical protein
MRRTTLVVLGAVVLLAGLASADTAQRWINVNVDEPGTGTKVKVHLPLDLVLTVIDGIKVENFDAGKVDLELEGDFDLPKILAAVKDAPDGEFVTVEDPEADVKVTKQAGAIYVHVTGKGEDHEIVDVKLPASIVDAITVDEQQRLDVKALLTALSTLPNGDLVTVTSTEANVRIWIE